jgi:hypothetical protein
MAEVYHALGFNMHQPLGNFLALHNSEESWEAKQILWCYDRPTRMLEGYEDVARLHVGFSGTLLKQFEDPAIREAWTALGWGFCPVDRFAPSEKGLG